MRDVALGLITLGLLLSIMWIVHRLRRPKPAVPWVPDKRSDEERLSSYAADKLRELGLDEHGRPL